MEKHEQHMHDLLAKSDFTKAGGIAPANLGAQIAQYALEQKCDIPEDIAIGLVRAWALNVCHIPNPSKQVQLLAAEGNGMAAIRMMRNGVEVSEDVFLAAVQQDFKILPFIPNPSEAIKAAAVEGQRKDVERALSGKPKAIAA
jgi:hypothetical protein